MDTAFDPKTALPKPNIACVERTDGSTIVFSREPLKPYARCVGEWLEQWAAERPQAIALAERTSAEQWRRLTWQQVRQAVGSIAQSLLDLRLPAGAPLVILSDNSVDHALLMLAGMHVGIPVCSVSSAYSRQTREFSKIRGILQTLEPALVYASDAERYGNAIKAAAPSCPIVLGTGADSLAHALAFDTLLKTEETEHVREAFERITADDHAKYLLTSGSTGHPKVVINTHRMLCANQQMMFQAWPFLATKPPVMVDWLPWSHTFGGNHNFNLVMKHGGSLYIDNGRPMPGLIEASMKNIAEIRPNLLFNVPRGYDMMLPFLEADDELAASVLRPLEMLFYAGAALSTSSWKRLQQVAAKVRTTPLWLTTSWGSTETAPAVTSAHWELEGAGCIGAPLPGVQIKLVPNGKKQEIRVRGVSVFPGYRRNPAQTAAAFDPEGFYLIGDAVAPVNPEDPNEGVTFDGRVAEDFKLSSGTWVSVSALRLKLISALAPYVQDAVITGHGKAEAGALLFPSGPAGTLEAQELRGILRERLQAMAAESAGSAHTVARVLVLQEPPSSDAGEITDKGYINQRAVLERRAADVDVLYAAEPTAHVVRA